MKKSIIIGTIVTGIVMIGIALFLISYEKPKIGYKYFTIEPEPWIEKNEVTEDPDDIEINVFKATRKKGIVDVSQEDYFINGDTISFFYHGFYKGNDFQTTFLKEEFDNISLGKTIKEQEALVKKYTLMKIGTEIDPNDGIINGLILGKEENGKFVFYIFVDEDWIKQLKYTNIVWGDKFLDSTTLHMRTFDFTKVKNGVYIDKIDEDVDFFKMSPVEGGIVVGEITPELLKAYYNYEDLNITFMMVR